MSESSIKKVAILGKLVTKFKAPFDDPSWDIWAFNWHKIEPQRVTTWFDIHARGANPKATITRQNFPFEAVERLVGGQYFNNSVSYLIAYAILLKYREIALYGVQFLRDSDERRGGQYLNVRELLMFARGRGIKVSAPYDTVMVKEYPLYGV